MPPESESQTRATQLLAAFASAEPARAPSVLVFAAHPDDEILGLGLRLSVLSSRASIAYVSDGAPRNPRFFEPLGFSSRQAYAEARRREARAALALLDVSPGRVHELGAVDQGVSLELVRVSDWALELILQIEPDLVISHPYEGGHPDHDATSFAVQCALSRLRREQRRAPALLEFASYHQVGGGLVFGEFIPFPGLASLTNHLSPDEQTLKSRLLSCHATQREVWQAFPLDAERFRVAPHYDFSLPPAALFYYDQVDWGVRGQDFLRLTRAALTQWGILC